MTLDFNEAAFGTKREININREANCKSCNGTGAKGATEKETCSKCHGSGMIQQHQQTLFGVSVVSRPCDQCGGRGQIIKTPCPDCKGAGRSMVKEKLEVKVPAGIDSGEMLTLRGKGEAGYNGGPTGDLYIEMNVRPHPVFKRHYYNTLGEVPITFAQACLGKTIEIPTIHGPQTYTLKEGTQPEDVITLKGKGIPIINRPNQFGDHIVTLHLEVPRHLNDEQKKQITKFDESCTEKNYQKRDSFFKKIKDLFCDEK